jgi:hypothetical protein
MEISTVYGDYALMNFTVVGATANSDIALNEHMTYGKLVKAESTNQALNSTDDIELILIDGQPISCGFSSLKLMLKNSHIAVNELGKMFPCDQRAQSATLTVNVEAEFNGSTAEWLRDKMKMTSKSVYGSLVDGNGLGYAYAVTAAQLTASDPTAGGQDQITNLSLSGEGKIGDGGESSLRIYQLGTL